MWIYLVEERNLAICVGEVSLTLSNLGESETHDHRAAADKCGLNGNDLPLMQLCRVTILEMYNGMTTLLRGRVAM